VAGTSSREVLRKGLVLMVRAIREEPRLFAISFTGACVAGLLTIGSAFVVGAVVARVVVPVVESGTVTAAPLVVAVVVLVGLSLFKAAGIVARRVGSGYIQLRLPAKYRRLITRQYLRLPLAWHHRHATGVLLSNASADVENAWWGTNTMAYAMATVIMLVVALGSLFTIDWMLAMVALAIFPTLFGLYALYSRSITPRYTRAQELRAEVSAIAHESFDGALVVKTMGREAQETARFAAKVAELRRAVISIGRVRGAYEPVVDSLPSVGTLLVLIIGAWRLDSGVIGVAELVGAAFLFALLDTPARAIGWFLTSIPGAVVGWDRVRVVLDAEGEMVYGPVELPAHGEGAEVRLDRVSFRYERATKVDELVPQPRHGPDDGPGPLVLHDVTFTVPPGSVVALVGQTGAGKSTIASLIARLLDPTTGIVSLDGTDARELTAASLARTVALVPQISFVFDDTVRANVALDRVGIDDERVWWALRLARADGFVARLPDGLDTTLGERGVILSGGQRQRLTLARAVAGHPRLLVLDDPTSAVDPRVEAAILGGLRSAEVQQSIIIIAYRPATIARADRVVYLERGRVAAAGTHAELLASQAGYADLVTAYEKQEAERLRAHAYESVAEEVGMRA